MPVQRWDPAEQRCSRAGVASGRSGAWPTEEPVIEGVKPVALVGLEAMPSASWRPCRNVGVSCGTLGPVVPFEGSRR
jgi:hypothetical protein